MVLFHILRHLIILHSKSLRKQDHGLIPGMTQHCITRNKFGKKANAVKRKTEILCLPLSLCLSVCLWKKMSKIVKNHEFRLHLKTKVVDLAQPSLGYG